MLNEDRRNPFRVTSLFSELCRIADTVRFWDGAQKHLLLHNNNHHGNYSRSARSLLAAVYCLVDYTGYWETLATILTLAGAFYVCVIQRFRGNAPSLPTT
jgi:hypothetical protein